MKNLANFRLHFILESKMAELNQNLKQPDRPDAV